jgi:hypothetical protein
MAVAGVNPWKLVRFTDGRVERNGEWKTSGVYEISNVGRIFRESAFAELTTIPGKHE